MVQQQEHIIRLIEVSNKADEQDDHIEAFEQYQAELAEAIELPVCPLCPRDETHHAPGHEGTRGWRSTQRSVSSHMVVLMWCA